MSDPTPINRVNELTRGHHPEHIPDDDEAAVEAAIEKDEVRGLWSDAWFELRRRPLFWIAVALIVIFVVMAVWPEFYAYWIPKLLRAIGLSDRNPDIGPEQPRVLSDRLDPPNAEAWFGYDRQGRDVYARTIYGAQVSILVGMCAAIGVGLVGGTIGVLSGYFGGWIDALLSRVMDIFFGLPFVLGAIVVLTTFSDPLKAPDPTRIKILVIATLVLMAWPQFARVMRSSVISTKQADYVQAARALGATNKRIILQHILPNAIAPLIVMTTIALGVFVGAEATLSFLGVGLRPPITSWGVMISDAQEYMESAAHMLLFPSAFLSAAVLGFVMLGETVREALDPKLR